MRAAFLMAVLRTDLLAALFPADVFFAATGITDGELLRGVHYVGNRATTESLVMRSKSGTVRMIEAHHRLEKLSEYASIDFR